MAATGFTPISLYYTTTASAAPTAGNLVAGELALNNNDGKLFYKDSSGVVQTIATKATAALPSTTTGSGSIVLATSPTVTNPALGGSTSGSVTLAVPAVAGTNTATLPAATGTVMVSGAMPTFSAYSTSNQSIPATTSTKITFDSEEYDTNNNFASSRFTPTVAGYYLMTATVRGNAGNNELNLGIWRNSGGGSNSKQGTILSAGATGTTCTAMFYMNGSTDYLEVYLYCASTCTTSGNQSSSYFQGTLIRAA